MSHEQTVPSSAARERPAGPKGPSAGEALEARVAQLWYWEGFYSRAGIDLTRHFGPEHLQVTDLDLVAFDFNPHLSRSKYIGEVKSGTGKSAPRPLDRVIWLRGLREAIEADAAELTIAHAPSDSDREFARRLGIVAQSISDFERREQESVGKLRDCGSHGIDALQERNAVRSICRKEPELERAYWFLRSGVWFLDPFITIKQLIDLLRRVKHRWNPRVVDDESRALRWLIAEGASVFTLNLVTVSRFSLTLERKRFSEFVSNRLAEGLIPMPEMRRLSDSVDQYVAGILSATNVPANVKAQAIGAFMPEPPEWAEPLAEIAWRLGRTALPARSLPRQVDLLVHERIPRNREVPEGAAQRVGLERADAIRLRTLVAAFLRGCDASPDILDSALTTPISLPGKPSATIPDDTNSTHAQGTQSAASPAATTAH